MKSINKKNLIVYGIMTAITCIIFLPLLIEHYSTDSYNIYNIGYYNYAIKYSLNDGRIFMTILGLLADKLSIPLNTYISITLLCSLIISNITVIVLNNIIKKYKKPQNIFQEILVTIISYITIFNFAYLENMYFVECIVMSLSTLLFLISANTLVNKKNRHFIKSLILTALAVMFYQGTIGMYITFVVIFTLLKNKNKVKQMIIDFIKCGIICAIALLSNLLFVKIIGTILQMKQSRLGSLSEIPENIIAILDILPLVLKENFGLFPKNVLLIVLLILTIVILIYQAKNLEKESIIYKYLTILFIAIVSSFILNIVSLTSFYSGRTKNSFGALVGIIFIFIYVSTDIFENKGLLKNITICTLISFFVLNIWNYENIILQHKKVNELEKLEGKEIEEYILQYERETGILVNKIIKICEYGKIKNTYFKEIKSASCFTQNALRCYWSADGFVNYYTKRNLKTVLPTKKEKEDYKKDYGGERKYKCIGDTLYVTVYSA